MVVSINERERRLRCRRLGWVEEGLGRGKIVAGTWGGLRNKTEPTAREKWDGLPWVRRVVLGI
jgi:hypothetical protein